MQRNAIMLISHIYEAGDKGIAAELAAAGLKDIVPSHGDVLTLLFWQKEATMHELAAFARRTKPTMTVPVGKLERMGLVRRVSSPLAARCQIVSLTPEGEKLRPDVLARLRERYADTSISELDRLSFEYPPWWFDFSCSNTAPLVRLNLEAPPPDEMASCRDEVLAFIRA